MGEVVNVLVAFAVIVFVFRWATSSNDTPEEASATAALGFRPKTNITQEMVENISNMFPDMPIDNIRYDLLRTGNVEQTSNKILERGFLDAPPASYYTLFPRGEQPTRPAAANRQPAAGQSSSVKPPAESLIARYKLEERVSSSEVQTLTEQEIGGKAVWEDSAAKREASLRERKAQMILAARQRALAQRAASDQSAPAG